MVYSCNTRTNATSWHIDQTLLLSKSNDGGESLIGQRGGLTEAIDNSMEEIDASSDFGSGSHDLATSREFYCANMFYVLDGLIQEYNVLYWLLCRCVTQALRLHQLLVEESARLTWHTRYQPNFMISGRPRRRRMVGGFLLFKSQRTVPPCDNKLLELDVSKI